MDAAGAIVGLAAGLAVGPVADIVATNAPLHEPLLRRVPFSPRLPLVTAATALLAGACGLVLGLTLEALAAAIFCVALVVVTRSDFEHRLIPDRVILPAALLVLVLRTIDKPGVEWILASVGASLALFLLVLAYPKGMGMGDVKLALLLGAGLGIAVVPGLFLGFLAAAIPAVALLVRYGAAARKRAIPLGPFLALGGVVALFAGDAILDWYW